MSLANLNLRPVYNSSDCPDLVAGLYEPLLEQAVRYDRTTYTFTANGLIAAAGAAAFVRNGGRIRLICDHTVAPEVLDAIHAGQTAAAALQQSRPPPPESGLLAGRHPRRQHLSPQKRHRRGCSRQPGRFRRQPQRNPLRLAPKLGIRVDPESRRQANKYLALLRQLARRTRDLLLLTATPMQLNEVELWALLELLESDGWNAAEYRRFHQDLPDAPDAAPVDLVEWKYRSNLWRKTDPPDAGDILPDSNNDDFIAIQLNDPSVRQASLDTMQRGTTSRRLMSRHT